MGTLLAALALLLQAAEPFRDYPETDVLAYDVDLRLEPEAKRVEGHATIRLRAERPLDAVRLDAEEGPGWELAFRAGEPLTFTREAPDRVRVALLHEVPAGEELTLEADFRGLPPDGLYFGATRTGEACVYTDHYAVRARGWLPCEDHPADRARFSLTLTVPAALEVVGTGGLERTGGPAPGGFARWHAESAEELPTYLLAFAAGPWARVPEAGDPRLRPHFVYRADVESARRSLVHHAEWMKLLESTFGPYAYGSYCVAQVPTRWGGMENAGNTWVSESLFDRKDGKEGGDGGVGTLAHELVHQWFGDAVGYADWREVWLSEGFASYFGPWLLARTGGPPLEQSMRAARERWLASEEGRTLPVRWRGFEDPDDALNANSYPKGAWVLHMLRKELGDAAFFAGLSSYYREHAGTAVTTDTLRASMERASGRDLGTFFAQWLDRPGCPELAFTWSPQELVVEQLQEGEPYDFLLPLRWREAQGALHVHDARIRARTTRIPLDGAPVHDGEVDPHAELLYRPR